MSARSGWFWLQLGPPMKQSKHAGSRLHLSRSTQHCACAHTPHSVGMSNSPVQSGLPELELEVELEVEPVDSPLLLLGLLLVTSTLQPPQSAARPMPATTIH